MKAPKRPRPANIAPTPAEARAAELAARQKAAAEANAVRRDSFGYPVVDEGEPEAADLAAVAQRAFDAALDAKRRARSVVVLPAPMVKH